MIAAETIATANKLAGAVEAADMKRGAAAVSVANFVVNGFDVPQAIRDAYIKADENYRLAFDRLLKWQYDQQPGDESRERAS